MAPTRIRLGELLVEAQIITNEQLHAGLERQKRDGRRLGTLLVEDGVVTETQVTQILSQQLSVPWVSLYHIDFSRQLLNLVPHELAERHCLVPIFVRRVRGVGDALYLAMDNPEDEAARQEVSQFAGLPVRAMIAPPSDIRAAINAYYKGTDDTRPDAPVTSRLAPSVPPPPPVPKAVAPSAPPPAPRRASVRPPPVHAEMPVSARSLVESAGPESEPPMSARDVSLPPPTKGGARMITMTLLDGTKINLPAKKPAERESLPGAEHEDLTARDLVAALRAVSHGADATEVLGESVSWEKLFAALLSVLLRKHLIADWEFGDEYRKI